MLPEDIHVTQPYLSPYFQMWSHEPNSVGKKYCCSTGVHMKHWPFHLPKRKKQMEVNVNKYHNTGFPLRLIAYQHC